MAEPTNLTKKDIQKSEAIFAIDSIVKKEKILITIILVIIENLK